LEERTLNSRCRDILSDARKATQDAIAIGDIINEEFEKDSFLFTAIQNHFQNHLRAIDNLQDECLNLDHDRNNQAKIVLHNRRMEKLVGAPFRRSGELVLLQSWVNQQAVRAIKQESEFAGMLIRNMLYDLGIKSTPLVVFSDYYQFLDLDTHLLIAIPFAYLHSYDRWWAIAHEIGHAFYARNKEVDADELLELLTKNIPDKAWEKEDEIRKMLFIWVRGWLPELMADFIALSLFGLYYLTEAHHIDTVELGMGGASHPPLSFRFSCLHHILRQKGIDTTRLDQYFDETAPEWLDPVLNSLLNERLVPIFIEWVLKQPRYAELEFRWHEIQKVPSDSRFSSLFAAICLESYDKDMTNEFSLLKKKLLEEGT